MAGWTAVYLSYHVLVALLAVGPTNFNGDPKQLTDYVFDILVIALIAGLVYAIPVFIKGSLRKAFSIAIPAAFLPWAASAIIYSDAGGLVVPLIYAGGILLLGGGYWLMIRQPVAPKRHHE